MNDPLVTIPVDYLYGIGIVIAVPIALWGFFWGLCRILSLVIRRLDAAHVVREAKAEKVMRERIDLAMRQHFHPFRARKGWPICPKCGTDTYDRRLLKDLDMVKRYPFHWWFCECGEKQCKHEWIMIADDDDFIRAQNERNKFCNVIADPNNRKKTIDKPKPVKPEPKKYSSKGQPKNKYTSKWHPEVARYNRSGSPNYTLDCCPKCLSVGSVGYMGKPSCGICNKCNRAGDGITLDALNKLWMTLPEPTKDGYATPAEAIYTYSKGFCGCGNPGACPPCSFCAALSEKEVDIYERSGTALLGYWQQIHSKAEKIKEAAQGKV